MRTEPIGIQKDSFKRELKYIISRSEKYLHDIELLLIPGLTRKTDDVKDNRLKQAVINHIRISSNIKEFETEGIGDVDNPLTPGWDITLCKLIIEIKAQ